VRLATRVALASVVAVVLAVVAIFAVFRLQLGGVLQERVDQQLERRARSAPILVAIADRLAASELRNTVEGAVVRTPTATIALGQLPDGPLPLPEETGFATARVDGERWRLYTVEVTDVPAAGDRALVQLAAPLGDTDQAAARLRRRSMFLGGLAAVVAGALGYALGLLASRPLARLRRNTAAVQSNDPATWQVPVDYGAPEVDEVAATLNDTLHQLSEQTRRRDEALAAARAFASGATHELRTPLQSSLMNLDIAASPHAGDAERQQAVRLAHDELQRMGSSLAAVRALADAELADRRWFEHVDLADLVAAVVGQEARRFPGAHVDVRTAGAAAEAEVWADGVRLAVANAVRNALVHARGLGVVVSVEGAKVVVDDSGPGIPVEHRRRVLERFERNTSDSDGSGLGLAVCREVAQAHGGDVSIESSPTGGTRVVLRFSPAS
jgi:two-component system sensor histidine kinase PrrB